MVRTRYVPESETYRNFGFRLNRIIPRPSIDLELGIGLSGVLVAAQIRSSLTFPVTWVPVANMALTIFLRLRQYVHHMYLGGHTKAQGKKMFGCRTIAALVQVSTAGFGVKYIKII